MIEQKIAVDTNILLYSLDVYSLEKQAISQKLLALNPFICSQNMSELINTLAKKWKYSKEEVMYLSNTFLKNCEYFATTRDSFNLAFKIVEKYRFQIFDSLILASALQAKCTILYSEDMQHNQLIENKLRIIDPYI